VLAALLPAEPEVLGLLALMLLHDARRAARFDGLDLPGYQYWHSTRAELLRRLGRADEARAAFGEALALARTVPERRFLERRIAET
jgi:predicted RNA polymerase sigma factor